MSFALMVQLLVMFLLSVTAATLAIYLLTVGERRRDARLGREERQSGSAIFLFNEEQLADANEAARDMLDGSLGDSDLQALLDLLARSFPDLEVALAGLPESGSKTVGASDSDAEARLDYIDGMTRITIIKPPTDTAGKKDGGDDLAAMEQELETLRGISHSAPFLIWKTDDADRITWANSAYIKMAQDCDPDNSIAVWPPQTIFPSEDADHVAQDGLIRARLNIPGEIEPRHFERRSVPMADGRLHMAVPADSAVRAEVALQDFVQTMTKTFAHLTIGLAIFDKQRRLGLFNPALGALTTLKPEFLSTRPTLQTFLDRLRDKRMIPEPRDYKSWRQQMYELEAAAKEGTYEETWPLPNGQTFRVTGRPHPGGAIAFMIEDKSAEISLARRYRTELETGQAVLDSIDEAIAVFSNNGTLTLSNSAYAKLWGKDPSQEVLAPTIIEATRQWSQACAPNPVWGELRDFVGPFAERAEWATELRLNDGRGLYCRFAPLAGGSTLVGFRPVSPEKPKLPEKKPAGRAIAQGRKVSEAARKATA